MTGFHNLEVGTSDDQMDACMPVRSWGKEGSIPGEGIQFKALYKSHRHVPETVAHQSNA